MSRVNLVPTGKGAGKRRRRQVLLRFIALVGVVCLLGLGVWVVKDWVTRLLVKAVVEVQPAQKGQLAETRQLTGWLIRDETVVAAPAAGRVERLVQDGERVRVGLPVVRLKGINPTGEGLGQEHNVLSPRAGLVIYCLDGLEGILTLRVLDERDPTYLQLLGVKPVEVIPGARVEKGSPVFKIINNLEKAHFLTKYQAAELGGPLVPGRRLTLAASPAGPNFSGKVVNVRGGEDGWALIQLLNPTVDVIKERHASLLIVDKVHKGIVLPQSALVFQDGETGVWLSAKNRAEWRPVKVLVWIGDQVVVEGIEESQLVVQNPTLVKAGQEIN
ncbi:MAG: HlyD family efflux transporter periplasmic adaptor subunit [Heliobacteriaceae bacterium]|nr:HlyD family efflux transporter periplasmic adaptor subunit [Heliobacteriaceae bacterium]MDD4587475.1 HlyD family efflux transporter periplasmic adaptor subunit [Heliobacteriaceae bacterium]